MPDVARQAAMVEADGWDGVMLFDSQSLIGDPYVAMTLAATATRRLGVGVGVTNPVTRHAAVTASIAASVQAASGGRAVVGLGRGNSSLAFLGAAPASLAAFEEYLQVVQALLSGNAAPVEALLPRREGVRPLDPSSLGRAPDEARLQWLDPSVPKTPVEVAATGPKAIAIGARWGDRLSFSVGAVQQSLARSIALARAAAEACGRPAPPLTAYVAVAVLNDQVAARRLVAPDVAMHAHIGAMSAAASAGLSEADRRTTEDVAAAYDMTRHGRHGAQTEALEDDFIDTHAIAGSPSYCAERLRALAALGLDRLVLMMAPPVKAGARRSYETASAELLPKLREG